MRWLRTGKHNLHETLSPYELSSLYSRLAEILIKNFDGELTSHSIHFALILQANISDYLPSYS